ncbi:MAG: hypothetical protein KF900_14110 [Bacteroidetes bacterium]|nr:hypothetical protein [Bacteroidota bacterium]
MKTTADINQEINYLLGDYKTAKQREAKGQITRLHNQIENLKTLKLFLETQPSEATLLRDKENLEAKIKLGINSFNDPKKRAEFINPLKKQLKTINYLLND